MNDKYQVFINGSLIGEYEGASEQATRDLCAIDAGYKSEADMVKMLCCASELVATLT